MSEVAGQIIGGDANEIIVRQKAGVEIELGELLVAETSKGYVILEAFDLLYGSQIGQLSRELMAGMRLEGYEGLSFMEPHLANYMLAKLKPLIAVSDGREWIPKKLPKFFSDILPISKEHLSFITKPAESLYAGNVRSGSRELDVEIFLTGRSVLSHHVLVPATTGRGKSNLVKVLAWSAISQDYCSMLILDPHDEYYGRNGYGLKDHPSGVVYYSLNPPPGSRRLVINVEKLRPRHFEGDVIPMTDAQREAIHAYYNEYGDKWVKQLLLGEQMVDVKPETVSVLRRRFNVLLGIKKVEDSLECKGIFDLDAGRTTVHDICNELENGKTVIIDTSLLSSELEILVGSMIARDIFHRYRDYKLEGTLKTKPIISIVLEEAPRVLGRDVVGKGGNIFEQVAREGRKFGIGLVAITQLPSMIPKEILANMNTKIILGNELSGERTALIESASQDLSRDDRNIASLDIGEAIITSNFTKFAVPVKIPLFEDHIKNKTQNERRMSFRGFS